MIALIILILLIVLFIIASFSIIIKINNSTLRRGDGYNNPFQARYDYYEKDCPRKPVSFKNDLGTTLNGYVYPAYGENPEGKAPKALMIFVNGIMSVPEEYLHFISHFQKEGYTVLTYCAGGYGYSEGKDLISLHRSPYDFISAYKFAKSCDEYKDLPIVSIGHSWGAHAVTAGLYFEPDVAAAVALSGFDTPKEVTRDVLTSGGNKKIFNILYPTACIVLKLKTGGQKTISAVEGINKENVPVLISHGKNDTFIHYAFSSIISHKEEIKNPNAEYISLDEVGRSEHDTFFLSKDAAKYNRELTEELNAIKSKNNGTLSENELKEFMSKIDYDRLTKPNSELLATIDAFYDKVLYN